MAVQPPFSAREVVHQIWGLDLPVDLDHQLAILAQLLSAANQRLNLTSVTDPREVWTKHFLDSLSVVPLAASLGDQAELVDVGAGAGFPGLVLALALPTRRVTLIEATAKKGAFIRETAEALELHNATVVVGRAEELARQTDFRERFDAAVARAVGSAASLVELLAPLVRVSGQLWLMKTTATGATELAQAAPALDALGCELRMVQPAEIPGLLEGRCVVVVDKRVPTSDRFPRRTGIAQKRPLMAGADRLSIEQSK